MQKIKCITYRETCDTSKYASSSLLEMKWAQFLSRHFTRAPAACTDILWSKLIKEFMYNSFSTSVVSVSPDRFRSESNDLHMSKAWKNKNLASFIAICIYKHTIFFKR